MDGNRKPIEKKPLRLREDIVSKVLRVFYRRGSVVLRIVKWNDRPPVLEKRRMLRLPTGQDFPGRVMGLDALDLSIIEVNHTEIQELLQ